MKNYQLHGKPPYNIVLIHGGPGAWGEMAEIALALKDEYGIIETFQTESSLDGQIDEIFETLKQLNAFPLVIVGFSWGAWLGYLLAARYSSYLHGSKIILIGSGPYEEKYYQQLVDTRKSRMNKSQRELSEQLFIDLQNSDITSKENIIQSIGKLYYHIDQFDPVPFTSSEADSLPFSPHEIDRSSFFQDALETVKKLRKTGELLKYGQKITNPVIIIHGDYDPHPYQGVIEPLSSLKGIKLTSYILKNSGHKPWVEKQVSEEFFHILHSELEFLKKERK